MLHNITKAHCLCRPSAARLDLILVRDGESLVAPNRLSFQFFFIEPRITFRSILHLDTSTGPVRARRQLGTRDVRSKQKKEAWHRSCLIKSARSIGEREPRHNDTSLAVLDEETINSRLIKPTINAQQTSSRMGTYSVYSKRH